MKTPSVYLFTFISLIIGSLIAGPGFGLAMGMATWYLHAHRQHVFCRWPKVMAMNQTVFGFSILIVVFLFCIGVVSGLEWLVQSSMGPGRY